MELTVHLPKPHPKQAAFRASTAKRKVIVAGRRGGKTTGAAMIAVEDFLAGHRVLEAAPTADQTSAFWDACKRALVEPIAAGIIHKNETERILEAPGFGRIRSKTAWNADTLRGDYADKLILDEYSLMDPSTWDEVGAPMLLDNGGDAIFIFTPKRRNHAYKMYNRAKADTTGRYGAWHFTSFDNPHLNKAALDDIMFDMTDEAYRQEILAEFLEGEGAVFRNIDACMNAPYAMPDEHRSQGHTIIAGIDLAKQSDFTAISIGCATCHSEIARDRFNKIDYTFQVERIKNILALWGVTLAAVDQTGVGSPIVERLQQDLTQVSVYGFLFTATSKSQLVESMSLAFDRVEWQYQPDELWKTELEAYERKVSASTGRSSYSAPQGINDDTVMARGLMMWVSGRSGSIFL